MRVGAGEGDPSGMGAVHGDCSPSVSGSPAWSLQGYMALTVPPLCPWDGKQHPIHPSIRACLCPHSLHALGWCCLLHGAPLSPVLPGFCLLGTLHSWCP